MEAAQLTLQSPPEHARAPVAPPETGCVQVVVQSPQWSASLVVLMHCPPQFVVPPGQDTMQAPPEQTSFCPQARPHCPQCWLLLERFTHCPPQAVKPALHAMPQLPLWHTATPFGGAGQALPHAPQLAAEV